MKEYLRELMGASCASGLGGGKMKDRGREEEEAQSGSGELLGFCPSSVRPGASHPPLSVKGCSSALCQGVVGPHHLCFPSFCQRLILGNCVFLINRSSEETGNLMRDEVTLWSHGHMVTWPQRLTVSWDRFRLQQEKGSDVITTRRNFPFRCDPA